MFCAVEAVWGLIHAGILLPSSNAALLTIDLSTAITQQHGNSSRYSGGEPFHNLGAIPYFPLQLTKSRRDPKGFMLTDPDLYLQTLQPHVPHPEVVEALEEA